jgi:putative endonuclease
MEKETQKWFVYILQCNDNTLYTGITTNLTQRLHEHNHGSKGAKYTRGRRPVSLLYSEKYPSRSAATSREFQIKQFPRKQKQQLIGKFKINALDY